MYLNSYVILYYILLHCRLFEDRGNFCAPEVAEYNKRLEKMTLQVTATEQSLSTELKTVEPKKVEQIAKIIRDFEDRWNDSFLKINKKTNKTKRVELRVSLRTACVFLDLVAVGNNV